MAGPGWLGAIGGGVENLLAHRFAQQKFAEEQRQAQSMEAFRQQQLQESTRLREATMAQTAAEREAARAFQQQQTQFVQGQIGQRSEQTQTGLNERMTALETGRNTRSDEALDLRKLISESNLGARQQGLDLQRMMLDLGRQREARQDTATPQPQIFTDADGKVHAVVFKNGQATEVPLPTQAEGITGRAPTNKPPPDPTLLQKGFNYLFAPKTAKYKPKLKITRVK